MSCTNTAIQTGDMVVHFPKPLNPELEVCLLGMQVQQQHRNAAYARNFQSMYCATCVYLNDWAAERYLEELQKEVGEGGGEGGDGRVKVGGREGGRGWAGREGGRFVVLDKEVIRAAGNGITRAVMSQDTDAPSHGFNMFSTVTRDPNKQMARNRELTSPRHS